MSDRGEASRDEAADLAMCEAFDKAASASDVAIAQYDFERQGLAALKHYIHALRSEREARAADEWQPIETAPKDGEVLCFDRGWCDHGCAIAENFSEYWQVQGWDEPTTHFKPTHWRPLPPPPEALAPKPT